MKALGAAVLVALAIGTAALCALLAWAEHRQAVYRRRLSAGPMHVHERHGRKVPCYRPECAPERLEVAA